MGVDCSKRIIAKYSRNDGGSIIQYTSQKSVSPAEGLTHLANKKSHSVTHSVRC